MCTSCVAQGAAYVGVGVAGLRFAGWRARTRARSLTERRTPSGDGAVVAGAADGSDAVVDERPPDARLVSDA